MEEREEFYFAVKQKFREMLEAASSKTVMEELAQVVERLVTLEVILEKERLGLSEEGYRSFLSEHWEEIQQGTYDRMNWIIGRVYGKEG